MSKIRQFHLENLPSDLISVNKDTSRQYCGSGERSGSSGRLLFVTKKRSDGKLVNYGCRWRDWQRRDCGSFVKTGQYCRTRGKAKTDTRRDSHVSADLTWMLQSGKPLWIFWLKHCVNFAALRQTGHLPDAWMLHEPYGDVMFFLPPFST